MINSEDLGDDILVFENIVGIQWFLVKIDGHNVFVNYEGGVLRPECTLGHTGCDKNPEKMVKADVSMNKEWICDNCAENFSSTSNSLVSTNEKDDIDYIISRVQKKFSGYGYNTERSGNLLFLKNDIVRYVHEKLMDIST